MPLSIFQEIGEGGEAPPPPKPSVRVEVEPGRNGFEIRWPNVVRIQSVLKPTIDVDWSAVEPLTLDPNSTPMNADIAPSLTGIVNLAQASEIDLEKAAYDFRLQHLIFRATRKLYRDLGAGFNGDTQYLAIQLVRLVEQFLGSDKLKVPARWYAEPIRRRLLIGLNIDTIVARVSRYVRTANTTRLEPLFDEQLPIGSTRYMRAWLTTKPCVPTRKSQISHAVHDSTWEKAVVEACEKSGDIVAWAKNDHLDFVVRYLWEGSSRRFIPDFLIRLANGQTLVLEVKGQDSERNRAKRDAMHEWVDTVNQTGGFGIWCFDTVFDPAETRDVIERHVGAAIVVSAF